MLIFMKFILKVLLILLIFLKLMFRLVLRKSEKFFRVLVIFLQISFQHTKKDLDIIYKKIVATRLEPNSPNTIYCYDVRRNGKDKAGKPNRRSVENSEKAKILRPELYEKFKADSNYSFFFSDNPSDEKTDAEIIREVTNRQ